MSAAIILALLSALSAAASPASQHLTRELLVGRWTDSGMCGQAQEFMPNGRVKFNNGVEGVWSLSGDKLTVRGFSTVTQKIQIIDENHLLMKSKTVSYPNRRCPSARTLAMPALPTTPIEALAMSKLVTPDFLTGDWTADGNCAKPMYFGSDGNWVGPEVETGYRQKWSLSGHKLILGQSSVEVRAIGSDRLLFLDENNRAKGQLLRC